jgi:glyoxylase-like metal-dependent hydrolase (beta-lactamase superfamily II)
MNEIAPGVFVETGYALVTVGAVRTSQGWVCVDTPPYPRDARSWLASLRKIDPSPVRFVINTNSHRDRLLGNSWFDAPVVMHNVAAEGVLNLRAPFISQAADELSANDNELVEIASLKIIPPQISFERSLSLFSGGIEIVLQHHPGPMNGHCWATLPASKVIFVGDTLVNNIHPYITEGYSAEWLVLLRTLRQEKYATWTIIPGRGELDAMPASEALSEYLRVIRRRVMALVRDDQPRSDVSSLIADLLPYFPYDSTRKEEVQRRIRLGLEAIYDEIKTSQDNTLKDE